MRRVCLADVAQVVRSKNAGPFLLTLDVVFYWEADYRAWLREGVFTPEAIAARYGLPVDRVVSVTPYDPACAVKVTLLRPVASGSFGDRDVYGAQQHAPLLDLEMPVR